MMIHSSALHDGGPIGEEGGERKKGGTKADDDNNDDEKAGWVKN